MVSMLIQKLLIKRVFLEIMLYVICEGKYF